MTDIKPFHNRSFIVLTSSLLFGVATASAGWLLFVPHPSTSVTEERAKRRGFRSAENEQRVQNLVRNVSGRPLTEQNIEEAKSIMRLTDSRARSNTILIMGSRIGSPKVNALNREFISSFANDSNSDVRMAVALSLRNNAGLHGDEVLERMRDDPDIEIRRLADHKDDSAVK